MSANATVSRPVSDGPLADQLPFDAARLDTLMEAADIDALIVTAKHTIQYLLGGYRYFFYSASDAHGLSRYMPCLVYVRGRPEEAAYVGSPMEIYEKQHGKFWTSVTRFDNMTVEQSARSACQHLSALGRHVGRVGVQMEFMPAAAWQILRTSFGEAEIVDANFMLEILRAVKTPAELACLRLASEKVVESLLAVFAKSHEGITKHQLAEALTREETARGLHFDYALINMGTVFNRAPSEQAWQRGETLALDSGGSLHGYIGDLCRMGVLGQPDAELEDLLGEVEEIQQSARRCIRAGVLGGDIYREPDRMVARSKHRAVLDFTAHGMGLVGHEAPWLTDRASVPYAAHHADRPLETGMVISVETTLSHPARGFIKIEDTIAVTAGGWESFGDGGRGWNQVG